MFFDQLNHPSAWIRSSAEQSLLELGHTIGPQLDLLPRSSSPESVPKEILELSETIDPQPGVLSPSEIESNYVERALHDIVNLLTPIDFELQLLEDQTELPEHIRKSVEFAAQSARFLAEIAKSTVDVRRREVTGEGLKLERLSFNQLVLEVCEHGLPRALSQERLFLQLPEQEIFLESHGTLLSRALLNLLWNACKYSPQRSLVELSLREDAEGVELEVRDRGPGLSEGDQQRLFAAFQRGTRHIGPSEQSSFGLGLSTALRLIRQLGGEIAWKQREGGGSVFQIRFVQEKA